jgi:hypothetical protein
VKGQEFYNCLSKLPGAEIDIETSEAEWKIIDDKIKISIKLIDDDNILERFKSLTPADDWFDIDGEEFNKALKVCTIRNNNSSFGGIYFKDKIAFSTNKCGAITITADVTSVTATKGTGSVNNKSIGKGDNSANGTQTCGTITIGGVEKEQSEFTGDTYTYPPRTNA